MYEKVKMIVRYIVGNDEYKMRVNLMFFWKKCEWIELTLIYTIKIWESKRVDHMRLHVETPEPIWIANLTHRTKFITSNIFSKYEGSKKANCWDQIWSYEKHLLPWHENLNHKTKQHLLILWIPTNKYKERAKIKNTEIYSPPYQK